ncbi:MAG: flavodoxin family protein [Candidatus Odinarchaeota archaeon]
MQILIVYYSESGNTKKVVDLLKHELSREHQVTVRNALAATTKQVEEAELLVVGTPVHGYILFGQKPAKPIKSFLKEQLPDDLDGKPVIGFATYLFFPAGALNHVKKVIETRNGKLLGLITEKRTKKPLLVRNIIKCVRDA